jgi:hypothetical protein
MDIPFVVLFISNVACRTLEKIFAQRRFISQACGTTERFYWHSWRERLDRPGQSRLHRKEWAYSDL